MCHSCSFLLYTIASCTKLDLNRHTDYQYISVIRQTVKLNVNVRTYTCLHILVHIYIFKIACYNLHGYKKVFIERSFKNSLIVILNSLIVILNSFLNSTLLI